MTLYVFWEPSEKQDGTQNGYAPSKGNQKIDGTNGNGKPPQQIELESDCNNQKEGNSRVLEKVYRAKNSNGAKNGKSKTFVGSCWYNGIQKDLINKKQNGYE